MHVIGVGSALYLLYVVVLLPWLAFRSARAFNARWTPGGALPTAPSLARIYMNTALLLAVLFAFAWFTARSFGYRIFAFGRLGGHELLAGAGVLLVSFALTYVNVVSRPADDARTMVVDRLLPETARDKALYALTSVVAGVAEEAAYRGVLMTIVWYALGNPWLAAFVSALAFALAHALQGRRSMVVIFAMACAMQALVWYSGTLVMAMAVHAIYDLLAPTFRRRILPALPITQERSAG